MTDKDRAVSKTMEAISEEKKCTLHQVAQAYIMQKTTYVFPIIGLRKVEHLDASIQGLGVALDDEDIDKIDHAYEFDHGFPHTFLSGTLFDDGSHPWPATEASHVWLSKAFGKFDWVETEKPIRPTN